MSLLKHSGTIGALTLVSRVLGLARDMLMARFVGAGLASDAFLIAFRIPNLFRALFAEGAFSAVFVPMFNRRITEAEIEKAETGRAAAIEFASQVLSVMMPFLILFTVIMMLLAAPLVSAMTGGFPDGGPEKYALTVYMTRITLPYLGLISIVSLLGGILNSFNRFWVNAAAPILLNICMIVALVFFRGDGEIETAISQSIAVTASGMMQLLWLILSCRQAGVKLRIGLPRLSPGVKRMLWLIGPAAIGQGAIQFNLLVSTSLAARFLPGSSISWLYYADRMNQLPLGILGIGVGTAILPALSRQISAKDGAAAENTQNRALELSLFLALPAAIALAISATPLIRGVFEHGAFTATDTLGTASALAAFALGVPAYVLIKVLTPGFYAREDTRTPVRIAVVSMLVNLVGNLVLIWQLGVVGLALSTAAAAWVNMFLLYYVLHRRGHLTLDTRLLTKSLRIVAAGAIMGIALWLANPLADSYMAGETVERVIALGLLCGGGGGVYALATFVFRAYRISELKQLLRRK